MGSIHVGDQLEVGGCNGDRGKVGVDGDALVWDVGEVVVGCRSPINDAPLNRVSEVDGEMLQGLIMNRLRSNGELCQSSDGVSNVNPVEDISIED